MSEFNKTGRRSALYLVFLCLVEFFAICTRLNMPEIVLKASDLDTVTPQDARRWTRTGFVLISPVAPPSIHIFTHILFSSGYASISVIDRHNVDDKRFQNLKYSLSLFFHMTYCADFAQARCFGEG